MAALPAAGDGNAEALRAVAQKGVDSDVKLELTAEQQPGGGEGGEGGGGGGGEPQTTYKLTVTAGPEQEEYEGLTVKKGRSYIVTKVNSASKLIKLEETGGSLPDVALAPGNYTLSMPKQAGEDISPSQFEGDVAKREGMGGLAAVDEVTMVVCPDVMAFAGNGDDTALRDLQGKMIAHCERLGDRMAILDPLPDLSPQEVNEWRRTLRTTTRSSRRCITRGSRSVDPRSKRPMHRAAVGPHGRRLRAHRQRARRPQGAGERGRARRRWRSRPRSRRASRTCSTRAASTASARSRDAASASGARARCRATRRGATSTCGGSSTTSRSRSERDAVGGVRAQRRATCGRAAHRRPPNFLTGVWRSGALFGQTPERGVLREVRRRAQPAGCASRRGRW